MQRQNDISQPATKPTKKGMISLLTNKSVYVDTGSIIYCDLSHTSR